MARGLSDTQKTILKVINDLPEGSELRNTVSPMVKAKLYPDLYGLWPSPRRNDSFYMVKFPGWKIECKNNARVVISKSVRRLEKRGYLLIKTVSKDIYIPKRTYKGETIPEKFSTEVRICIYITHAGRQIVNG